MDEKRTAGAVLFLLSLRAELAPDLIRGAAIHAGSDPDCAPRHASRDDRFIAIGSEPASPTSRSGRGHTGCSGSGLVEELLHLPEQLHPVLLHDDRVRPFADLDIALVRRVD